MSNSIRSLAATFGIALFGLALIRPGCLHAAQLTYQTTAPTLGSNDVGNLTGATQPRNNVGGDGKTDSGSIDGVTYVSGDRPHQGQTFTTGSNANGYWVKAVWLRHVANANTSLATWWQTTTGQTLTVRVTNPAAAGTSAFALATELIASTGGETGTPNALAPVANATYTTAGTGVWLRFAFTTSIHLQPNTQYGFDVTSGSAKFFFQTQGICDAAASGGNAYTGGAAYCGSTAGAPDNTLVKQAGDRVFAVELTPYVAPAATPAVQAEPFALDRVRLLDGRFKSNQDLDRTGYLTTVTVDQLLYPFRDNAGLAQPAGAASLGGWEGGSGFTAVRGHIAGHWLSAASKMYAATGDATLLPRIQSVVSELQKCQAALATQTDSTGRSLSGYLSAFPINYFETLETSPLSAQVPFYTIHKIMAGLVDAYRYAGNSQALDMAIAMSDYHAARMSRLTAAQVEAMFVAATGRTEWGGMNETLTDLYLCSLARGDNNPQRHLAFAEYFERDWFLTPLASDVDELATLEFGGPLHANTHIPQVIGFADYASVLDPTHPQYTRLYTASDNFWHMVVQQHWLSLGGNSYSEHFGPPGQETGPNGSALGVGLAETCNVYNMLKLTSELFQRKPAVEYADYYEHALYNQILAALAPDTGMFTYYMSMKPGHFKTYSQPTGSSWCCLGTGMENPAQYGAAIYYHKASTLWVNLYIPSTLNWSEMGMTVRLDSSMPQSGSSQLTVGCATPTAAAIRLRVPGWVTSPATVTVNGVVQNVVAVAGTYVEISRIWSSGDVLGISLPMGLRVNRAMDDSNWASIFYGPILMAGNLGADGMPTSDEAADPWQYQYVADAVAPTLVAPSVSNLASWVQAGSQPLNFTTSATFASGALERGLPLSLLPLYDTHHTRYSVYWQLVAPSGLCTWNGGGAKTTWSTTANWDAAPAATYGLSFAAPAGGTPSNDLTAGTQFNGISFAAGAGAFDLTGNRVTLEGDVANASSVTQRIDLPLTLKDGIAWQFNAANADLILGGAITGAGVFNKQGAHTVTLLSDAMFTGTVRVTAGTLQVGNGGTAGSLAASIPVSLASGASIAFDRSDTVSVNSQISGPGTIIQRGTGTLQLLSPATQATAVVVEAGTLRLGSAQMPGLTHRWSFNNSLADSAGGSTAQIVHVGANTATLSTSGVTLTGGDSTSSDYVSLGSGLLPKDGSPATIELWATENALQNWARIFDVGSSTGEYLFMAWMQSANTSDRVEWHDDAVGTADNTYAPLAVGTKYHVVLTVEPGMGAENITRVTWYVAPASASSLGAARGQFLTANTLSNLSDTNFWLGRSEFGTDSVASATYDEVRIWNRVFSANELAALHAAGPDSIAVSGSLPATADLSLAAGGTFDTGGATSTVNSLAGAAGSTVNLNAGKLVVNAGGANAATFAGTFTGTGSVVNLGTLRLVGNALLPAGVTLVNNGVLDIMSWQGTLPAGFVNNGTVLDRSKVVVKQVSRQNGSVQLTLQGYSGHSYQLQTCPDLQSGGWTNVGNPVSGTGAAITLSGSGASNAGKGFFRVVIGP